MANRRRGEVQAGFDGRPHTLCLTLGALAELEDRLGAEHLVALAERFGAGRPSARDLIQVLAAGLRGGGHPLTDDEVAALSPDGGVEGAARAAAALLVAAFGGGDDPARPPGPA